MIKCWNDFIVGYGGRRELFDQLCWLIFGQGSLFLFSDVLTLRSLLNFWARIGDLSLRVADRLFYFIILSLRQQFLDLK